jgi:hypothetical protein
MLIFGVVVHLHAFFWRYAEVRGHVKYPVGLGQVKGNPVFIAPELARTDEGHLDPVDN